MTKDLIKPEVVEIDGRPFAGCGQLCSNFYRMRQRFGSTQVVGYHAPPESNLSVLDAGLSSQPGKVFSARNTGQIAGRLEVTLERAVRVLVVALEQGGGEDSWILSMGGAAPTTSTRL